VHDAVRITARQQPEGRLVLEWQRLEGERDSLPLGHELYSGTEHRQGSGGREIDVQ
jgi:hypothetical protein